MKKKSSQQGAVLVVVVISMIAAGLIGAAVLSLATSARYERVTFGITNRAYYLAESGAAYVRARSSREINYPPFEGHPPITNTFPNGDQFIVTAYRTNVVMEVVAPDGTTNRLTSLHTIATSIGIANPGTALEARQQISFDMLISGRSVDEVDHGISLFTGPPSKPSYNDDMFDETGTSKIQVKDTGPSAGIAITPKLDSKAHEGHIALAWQNKPGLRDALLYAYRANDNLLSYQIQMKLGYFPNVPSTHFMMGISFRLNNTTKESYGLSLFHSQTNSDVKYLERNAEWVLAMDNNFKALQGPDYHLVLWYRAYAGAPLQLMNSRMLPASFLYNYKGVQELKYYNTLMLNLQEVYTDESRTSRENHITATLATTNTYPVWPNYYTTNAVWSPDDAKFPPSGVSPVVWDRSPIAPASGNTITNIDTRLTSALFATNMNAELGIHLFYDRNADNESFFRDFAIKLEQIGSDYGGTQIQW